MSEVERSLEKEKAKIENDKEYFCFLPFQCFLEMTIFGAPGNFSCLIVSTLILRICAVRDAVVRLIRIPQLPRCQATPS
jgi:hypothetical protein